MKNLKIIEYFEDLEFEREYDGYFYSASTGITLVILGAICGLRNVHQIWIWASTDRVKEFMREKFHIERIPCYYWLLCLIKMIKPESLNKCFAAWVTSMIPADRQLTIAVDGKTIRSTAKRQNSNSALHIVSAQLAEMGLTYAQKTVADKSNEIPAVQELLEELDITGCMIVADALNCQRKTADKVVKGKADYLLQVKDNQLKLKKDIADYIHCDELRGKMDNAKRMEKNRGRIETRSAFTTNDIKWLEIGRGWPKLACIGAIRVESETKKGRSEEWHYYICSRQLTAEDLLYHARLEWSVETMHWLLDVHFGEDFCRIENRNVQQNLNMARKIALNIVKQYKQKFELKLALSNIMLNCLLDNNSLIQVLEKN